jgi:DNA-binding LacI/PurR family transcriptional regulator/DNA-binding transcriptional regulator YhcF (GntR family)
MGQVCKQAIVRMTRLAAQTLEQLPARRVYVELRRRIVAGDYPSGDKMPPEREVGEEFGVSRVTVAKAMAQLVNEGMIHRHRGRGTFVHLPPPDASAPAASRVTFISPKGRDQAVLVRRGVLEGLHEALEDSAYAVAVDFYDTLPHHLKCLAKYQDPNSAGFVLWPESDHRVKEQVSAMIAQGFPVVLVDAYLPDLDSDSVVTDNVRGGAMMVQHLAALGHQRIAYLTEPATRSSMCDRLTGFLRGMVLGGLSIGPDSIIEVPGAAPDRAVMAQAIDRLLASSPRPTALFCAHDSLAMSAYWALRERGIAAPAEISLAGYDDIDAAEHFALPLTTISQDYFEMGRVAGRILLERMENRPASVRYQKFIQPHLKIRDSVQAIGDK